MEITAVVGVDPRGSELLGLVPDMLTVKACEAAEVPLEFAADFSEVREERCFLVL
jgi:hypothetical protein